MALGGLEDAFFPGGAGAGAGEPGCVPEDLEGRLHVRRQGRGDGDQFLGDGVLEAEQLGVEGLPVEEGALRAVDLVAQQGEAPVCELDADLVAATRLKLHFDDGVAGQALHHAVVGDCFLGAGGHALAAAGTLARRGHGHLEGLGVLDEVAGQGAAVLRQFAHQDGEVDPLEAVQLEVFLQAVEGLGRLGEDQHAAGEAVQPVDDVEVEALEAPAPVGLGDGLGQVGLFAQLGGNREQARGLVDEEQVVVLPQGLERAGLQLARGRDHLVGPLGVEDDLDGIAGLQALAVLAGHLAVHGDAAAVDEALGLPVADHHDPVQLRGQGGPVMFCQPFPFDACHGAALRHRPASLQTPSGLSAEHGDRFAPKEKGAAGPLPFPGCPWLRATSSPLWRSRRP